VLHAPAHFKWSAKVGQALIDAGADVNAVAGRGRTPMFNARSQDKVVWLLDHGAAVDTVDNEGRSMAMYVTGGGGPNRSRAEDLVLVQVLAARGADLRRKSASGETLLHFAAKNKSPPPDDDDEPPPGTAEPDALIGLCLALGLGIDDADSNGNTPLSTAIAVASAENANILIARDARIDPDAKASLEELLAESNSESESDSE
jgi:ankyrin repeat protein